MSEINFINSSTFLINEEMAFNYSLIDNESNSIEYSLNGFENFSNEVVINLEEEVDKEDSERYFIKIDKKEKQPFFKLEVERNEKDSTSCNNKKQNRGRRKINDNSIIKGHKGNSLDNLLREIHVDYLNFLIAFINDILKNLNIKEKYKKLCYKYKIGINKKSLESYKNKTIGEIISNKESPKYKLKVSDHNACITKKIRENEGNKSNYGYAVLNKLLSMKYLYIFKHYYFLSNKKVDLNKYGMNKNIILSDNVGMLADLFKKKINYYSDIIACLKKYFIQNLNFIVQK